jgi:hypothetical protein
MYWIYEGKVSDGLITELMTKFCMKGKL